MSKNKEERKEYLDYLNNLSKLKAVIIGQDPYPNKATGIAFCKPSFSDLFNNNCSGKHVLNSLGITRRNIKREKERFNSPSDIFYYLYDNGIVFLNVSNTILNESFIAGQSKTEFNKRLFSNHESSILQTKEYNDQFLKKTELIFVLGKWKTQPIFEKHYPEYKISRTLIHPSNFNTEDTLKKKEWDLAYSKRYLLNLIKN